MNTDYLESLYNSKPVIKTSKNKIRTTKTHSSYITNYRSFTRDNMYFNFNITADCINISPGYLKNIVKK